VGTGARNVGGPQERFFLTTKENLQAATIELKEDDMMVISKLDRHFRYLDGSFWCPEGSPYTLQNLWDENEEDIHSEMVKDSRS
jgi:hypothetical protein